MYHSYGEEASRYDWLTSAVTVRNGLSSSSGINSGLGGGAKKNPMMLLSGGSTSDLASLLNSPPQLSRDISSSSTMSTTESGVTEGGGVNVSSTTHPFVHHRSLYFGKVSEHSHTYILCFVLDLIQINSSCDRPSSNPVSTECLSIEWRMGLCSPLRV